MLFQKYEFFFAVQKSYNLDLVMFPPAIITFQHLASSRYNPDTHDVVGMSKKLEEVFEDRFKMCPTGDEALEPPPQIVRPPPPQQPQSHPTAGLLVHHPPAQVTRKLRFESPLTVDQNCYKSLFYFEIIIDSTSKCFIENAFIHHT